MDKKKLGIVLILLAVIIAAVYLLMHCFYEKKAPEAKKEPAILEQEPDLSEPELNVKNDEEEEKIFEIRIPDAYLEILDMDEDGLRNEIESWTRENQDYGMATGAEFQDYCELDPVENKYSFLFRTITGDDGYPEEAKMLVLDYYKNDGKIWIHP
ncbi:hypothetical protein [uncultured Merdimonas sp.]|uniref:hypothetical protein n=1 Tax=uncultured Merdimonas sp. TaxID=2023269 RepID=UPI003208918C